MRLTSFSYSSHGRLHYEEGELRGGKICDARKVEMTLAQHLTRRLIGVVMTDDETTSLSGTGVQYWHRVHFESTVGGSPG
jgi:hypothetical protein